MKRRYIFSLSAITALGLPFLPQGTAHAQSAKELVGTWQFVSSVNTAPDGKKADTFGAHGTGMVIFDADGHFVLINGNPDVPKIASNNRVQGTAEENKAAFLGSLATFGTYSVSDKTLTYKVVFSTYPNWTGTDQKRTFTSFSGNEMKYTFSAAIGGQNETSWKKIK